MIYMSLWSEMRMFLFDFALDYSIRKVEDNEEEPEFNCLSQIPVLKLAFGKQILVIEMAQNKIGTSSVNWARLSRFYSKR